jgi:hypothetical protein
MITLQKNFRLFINRKEHCMSGNTAHEKDRRARVEILDSTSLINTSNDLSYTGVAAGLVVCLDIV